MYDRGLGVLEQYGLTAETVLRGRGALICQTEEGWKSIREYWGSPGRMEQQRKVQKHCREAGFLLVDQVLENREGQVVTTGEDGIPYVVKEWFQGNECNTRSREDILKSLEAMAQLHTVMQMEREDGMPGTNLLEECRKHNRELRKTRKFVQKKKMKIPFEELLAASITPFLEAGEMMVRELENSGYEHFREEHSQAVCHGDCNQHNIIFSREGAGFMNFEHWHYEPQTEDLCLFMRKILEKNNWDPALGRQMVEQYSRKRPLSDGEFRNLKLRLSYPWRYWKLVNYYAANQKVWISRKNIEKIEQATALWKPWQYFLRSFS